MTVNNSAIRSDSGGTGSTISSTKWRARRRATPNTFDGILLISGASSVQIVTNLVRDQRGGGIELGFGAATRRYTNVAGHEQHRARTTASTRARRPRPSGSAWSRYNYTGSNVVFSRNRVLNNAGPGLVMLSASGTAISQNSFSSNGGLAANSGLAIDLDPNTRDPNALGTPNGVDDQRRERRGHRCRTACSTFRSSRRRSIANGELSIAGFARPGSAIELYVAQADPSGFGEGLTYLGDAHRRRRRRLERDHRQYGPAAINGVLQGTDTTNRFAFRMPCRRREHRLGADEHRDARRTDFGVRRQRHGHIGSDARRT